MAAGIAELSKDTDGVFVFLGDMPRVPHILAHSMAGVLRGGAAAFAAEFKGQRGHPVLFGRVLFSDLSTVSGDSGAGRLLNELGDRVAHVQSPDDGVFFDVDRPEDLG